MADLSTEFCGVPIKNPLVSGAGPFAGSVEGVRKCIEAGFGVVMTKTASMFEYFHRFPQPRYNLVGYEYAEQGKGYLDWVWFHNDHNAPIGPAEFAGEVVSEVSGYARENNCLLIGTFAASTVDEWVNCAREYEKAGAGAIELNYCCPGVSALSDIIREGDVTAVFGDKLAEDPEATAQITRKVREAVNIPIICKIPPILRGKINPTIRSLRQAGADAVELYANSHGLRINIESADPVGWGCAAVNTSGHLADTLHDVANFSIENDIGIEIMAGRGLRKWSDAVEMLMAGAAVVETCTAMHVYGLGYAKDILDGIETFMDRKGYASIGDLRGKALPNMLKSSQIKDNVKPLFAKVAGKKCIGCGRCEQVCVYNAIEMFYKNGLGVAKISREQCNGCTICKRVCPEDAVEMEERTLEEYLRSQYYAHADSPELEESLKELQS